MKQYTVVTKRPYSGYKNEQVFTKKKDMVQYVSECEALIVSVTETTTTNVTSKYVNMSNKKHYRVDVNLMGDDEDYCSYVDEQWNYLVLANNKKEAEALGMELANERLLTENNRYLELVNVVEVHYNEKTEQWEK